MIRTWLILISGFRQDKRELTGMDLLFQRACRVPGLRVDYIPWDHDAEDWAAFIHRHAEASCRIVCAGYSWGGGRGAVALSEALRARARVVDHMLLADPVYRRKWVPTWFNLLPASLTDNRKIRLPSTVLLVDWWHQTVDKPSGHRPVGAREVRAGIEVDLPHSAMDECAEFQEAVLGAVTS